jgi:Histidine kinase-, DNA gyrase B-, and HSP90-like ATPase
MALQDKIVNTSEMINAAPAKNFFVEMLTRDIELEDAILDLLDNCVDGIQRTIKDNQSTEKPYQNFWAKINFSGEYFQLEDNCGGIPINVAKDYAFRMGRPINASDKDKDVYTIGTYGIGMKRAIFKMGRSSYILSQTVDDSFKVSINSEWLDSDNNWDLPLELTSRSEKQNGTLIHITHLRDGIAQGFSSEQSTLMNSLIRKISQHYSHIISKGFSILVNEKEVAIQPLNFFWEGASKMINQSEDVIAPFLYKAKQDGVDVEVAVGLYRPTASQDELDDDKEGKRRSSDSAGWTIICNDRVVVYCDKTLLTGWGEATVPNYHPQFSGISGIVSFHSKDTSKLPLTTTKRGVDASSEIYLYIKGYMREGLKLFIAYTNKWKEDIAKERRRTNDIEYISSTEIFSGLIPEEAWKPLRRGGKKFYDEKKYVPKLPIPPSRDSALKPKKIIFSRPNQEIQLVSEYLFEDSEHTPSEVGDESFNVVLREAKK